MHLSLRPLARLALVLLLIFNFSFLIHAQAPKTYTSSEILLGLKKLNVVGSVLYIAAHPDDENTRLLAYMANERLLETGYLSCTRGDGGQNLIGPELREGLGVIRTQELLAARRIDGARQFFTRANDFGFSKTPEETFTIWDKEQVLADMVWVIRQRRPDVLITRFPPDGRGGHGHHTASAMLAIEAFSAAGDAKRFPEQLQYVQPWQPRRLLWNTGSFFVKPGDDLSKFLKLDVGVYNPLLGQSYGEMAARSRSQHRSQGFGSAAQRGELLEYFTTLREGDAVPKDLFEGVDVSWNRVPGGAAIGKMIEEVIRKYDPSKPEASVAALVKVQIALNALFKRTDNNLTSLSTYYIISKQEQIDNLLKACLGLSIEATVNQTSVCLGQSLTINVEIVNRTSANIKLDGIDCDAGIKCDSSVRGVLLVPGKAVRFPLKGVIKGISTSQPYWLREPATVGMYVLPSTIPSGKPQAINGYSSPDVTTISRQILIGEPENPDLLRLAYTFTVAGRQQSFVLPIQYKHTDPSLGELYQPLVVVPPVMVNLPAARAYVYADDKPQVVPVTLKAGRAGVKGSVALNLPTGWKCEPASLSFELGAKDQEQKVEFKVWPLAGAAAGRAELRATATVDGQAYSRGIQQIVYPTSRRRRCFPKPWPRW
jgi:LmbE family N-acetylglucosaminyl deacetylase